MGRLEKGATVRQIIAHLLNNYGTINTTYRFTINTLKERLDITDKAIEKQITLLKRSGIIKSVPKEFAFNFSKIEDPPPPTTVERLEAIERSADYKEIQRLYQEKFQRPISIEELKELSYKTFRNILIEEGATIETRNLLEINYLRIAELLVYEELNRWLNEFDYIQETEIRSWAMKLLELHANEFKANEKIMLKQRDKYLKAVRNKTRNEIKIDEKLKRESEKLFSFEKNRVVERAMKAYAFWQSQ